jgi:hypothetical protein
MECGCAIAKLHAVHEHLQGCFPDHTLQDVHTPRASAWIALVAREAHAGSPKSDRTRVQSCLDGNT